MKNCQMNGDISTDMGLFIKRNIIKAKYEIISPMYLYAASGHGTLTPQSVKGVLRFCWRVVAWQDIVSKESVEGTEALQLLHHREAILFGSSAENQQKEIYGKGKVAVRLKNAEQLKSEKYQYPKYLGFGLEDKQQPLKSGQTFTFELSYLSLDESEKRQLIKTLKLIGLMGGFGAKTRRGFGSVKLTQLFDNNIEENNWEYESIEEYKEQLQAMLPSTSIPNATYSAITSQTGFAVSRSFSSAQAAHQDLNKFYQKFRTARVAGKRTQTRSVPRKKRIQLGLPIKDVDKDTRRSSPLFFHVIKVADKFYYTILFLPTDPFHYDVKYHNVDYRYCGDFLDIVNSQGMKHGRK